MLERRAMGPIVCLPLCLSGPELALAQASGAAKVEWHQVLFPRVGIVTNLSYPAQRNGQWPWHGGAVDQGGQVRPERTRLSCHNLFVANGETMANRVLTYATWATL